MTSCSTTCSSETTAASVAIKQEIIERDTPPSSAAGVSGQGEAAAVAAAAAAAVVQRHFRLGLTSSPSGSAVPGRRSTLGYSSVAPGSRASRMHSTAQPETCVCEVCQVELGRYEALFCHKLLHFNTSSVCYVCDLFFAGGADELRLHVATHHRDIAGLHPKASETAFVCPVCVQRFSTSKALMRHQAQLHSATIQSSAVAGRKVTCAICTVDFANERELLSHLVGAQHKDMKIKLQSIFICIDCRSIFSNRDAYAFHMMTRAQNETCDVISAAAAAAAAEVGFGQNGDAAYIGHQKTLASSPQAHGHRQVVGDARRAVTDSVVRLTRPASERYSSARAHCSAHLDRDAVDRRWLTGKMSNGPPQSGRALQEKRSGGASSSSGNDSGSGRSGGGGYTAPLNLTCQTADRRSTTGTPHPANTDDDSDRYHGEDKTSEDWSARQLRPDVTNGMVQRRSMSARSDSEQRAPKVRRRTCWSVDNISDQPSSMQSTVVKPSHEHRRQRFYPSPTVDSYQQRDVTVWQGAPPAVNSTGLLDYCSDVATTSLTSPSVGHSSSSHGLAESVPGRVADPTWSRVHQPSHDGDVRLCGSSRDAPARECSVVAQEPGAGDDDDDDALRQLLRLIQQPDGQPVFLCRNCDIIYADRMLYALHMGLHNVNNPWQCNICGTTCSGRQQFALHALHY